MVPIAQYGLDAQVRACLAHRFQRVGIKRVYHGHGQDLAQLVDRKQSVLDAYLFGHKTQQFIVDMIVCQAYVWDLALFDQERNEIVLSDVTEFNEDLPYESAVVLLLVQGFVQLLLRDDAFANQHLSQTPAVVGPGRRSGILVRIGFRDRSRFPFGRRVCPASGLRLLRGFARRIGAALFFTPVQHLLSSSTPSPRPPQRREPLHHRNCTIGEGMCQEIPSCKVLCGNNLST